MADALVALKARAAKLEQTILDKDTRDYFLGLTKHWIDDVERKVVPGVELMLPIIDQQLKKVEDIVAKYGPHVRIMGPK